MAVCDHNKMSKKVKEQGLSLGMKLYLAAGIIGSLFWGKIQAQHYHVPLHTEFQLDIDAAAHAQMQPFFSAIRPYRISTVQPVFNPDSVLGVRAFRGQFFKTWLGRKLFSEDLFRIAFPQGEIRINPAFDFAAGKDMAGDKFLWTNTRGVSVRGNLGKKFSFYTDFYENQAALPGYLAEVADTLGIIPGQGRSKPFKTVGYDYAWANGYIAFTPASWMDIEFGIGKNFIGDGYRSLLLSDASFNYPYLKINTRFWRIQYTNLWAEFQDIRPSMKGDNLNQKKYGAFHFLDFNLVRGLNLGLFEGVIFSGTDSTGLNRGLEWSYLNPIIFYRPVEYGLGSYDNVQLGANLKWQITPSHQLYGQIMLDELHLGNLLGKNGKGWRGNKQAFQLGYKYFNVFKVNGLHLQAEFNYVPPYTYSHWRPNQNYGHYNQSLAHPLGANFWEMLGFLHYKRDRWLFNGRLSYAITGLDTAGLNYGHNIYALDINHPKEYDNYVGQGLRTTLIVSEITASYMLNPAYGFRIEAGARIRHFENAQQEQQMVWFWLGLRTHLPNRYYDW